MVEKKKGKKRKEGFVPAGEEVNEKPSKDEYNIAKWLRNNVAIKKTKFLNHVVEYFTASKAIDALLDSKYAKGNNALFGTREEIVDFMQIMLEHKFYHRARKIPVSEQELKGNKKKTDKNADKCSEDKKLEKKEKDKTTDAEGSVAEEKSECLGEKVQRKRKIRLDMHNDQRFVDGLDAYVWIYDPIPFHYWFIGAFLVLGAIGVCLFPLWPPSVRLGVYYLSVAAAAFLVFIILLVVIRLILFCLVWLITAGKHHIWMLPNLTEDVGFFASFWPLYKYEYKGKDSHSKRKKKKDKDSDGDGDGEDDDETIGKMNEEKNAKEMNQPKWMADERDERDGRDGRDGRERQEPYESESESSQRSSTSTGKDFEIVDKDDEDFEA